MITLPINTIENYKRNGWTLSEELFQKKIDEYMDYKHQRFIFFTESSEFLPFTIPIDKIVGIIKEFSTKHISFESIKVPLWNSVVSTLVDCDIIRPHVSMFDCSKPVLESDINIAHVYLTLKKD